MTAGPRLVETTTERKKTMPSRNGRSRRRLAGVAVTALLALVWSAACSSGGTGDIAEGPIQVRMTAYAGNLASLPIIVASRKGFFKANRIEPELVSVTSGVSATQALLSGSVDVASPGVTELLTTRSKGQGVTFVAGVTTAAVGELVLSTRTPITPGGDAYPGVIQNLRGKRVGVSAIGSQSFMEVRHLLTEVGLDADTDVTLVPTGPFSAALSAMDSGQLDAFFSSNPTTRQVVASGVGRVILRFWDGDRPQLFHQLMTNGLAVTDDFAERNPDSVKALHAAIDQATTLLAGLDEAGAKDLAGLLAPDFPGVPADLLAQGILEYKGVFHSAITPGNIEAGNALTIENGTVTSPVPYEQAVAEIARR